MGISYESNKKKLDYKKYNIAIKRFLKKHNSKIIFEPGRSIIGDVGVLLSRIIYIKENPYAPASHIIIISFSFNF